MVKRRRPTLATASDTAPTLSSKAFRAAQEPNNQTDRKCEQRFSYHAQISRHTAHHGPLNRQDFAEVVRKLEAYKDAQDPGCNYDTSSSSIPSLSPTDSNLSSLDGDTLQSLEDEDSRGTSESSAIDTTSPASLAIPQSSGSVSSVGKSSIDNDLSSLSDSESSDQGNDQDVCNNVMGVFQALSHRTSLAHHKYDSSSDESNSETPEKRLSTIPLSLMAHAKNNARRSSTTATCTSQTEATSKPQSSNDEIEEILLPSAALVKIDLSAQEIISLPISPPKHFKCIPTTTVTSTSQDWYVAYEEDSKTKAFFETHVPKTSRIVDLGCGWSSLAREMVLSGFSDVTGVDIDPQAIAFQKQNAEMLEEYLHFHCLDVRHLDRVFQSHFVDCMIAKAFFDLLSPSHLMEVLRVCQDFLRPGGVLVWISCRLEVETSWWLQPPVSSFLEAHFDQLASNCIGPLEGPPTAHSHAFVLKAFRARENSVQISLRWLRVEKELADGDFGWRCVQFRNRTQDLDALYDKNLRREGPAMLQEDYEAYIRRQLSMASSNEALIEAYTLVVEAAERDQALVDMAEEDVLASAWRIEWTVQEVLGSLVISIEAAENQEKLQVAAFVLDGLLHQIVEIANERQRTNDFIKEILHALVCGIETRQRNNDAGFQDDTSQQCDPCDEGQAKGVEHLVSADDMVSHSHSQRFQSQSGGGCPSDAASARYDPTSCFHPGRHPLDLISMPSTCSINMERDEPTMVQAKKPSNRVELSEDDEVEVALLLREMVRQVVKESKDL
ncbi:unnamed protein product [Aphanomyces euteiches]|nr:hypothetical protein Ae201684P_005497 [Aphanomyces euteiches]